MIYMPANNTGIKIGYLAGKYTGQIAHLLSPIVAKKKSKKKAKKKPTPPGPFPFLGMTYALDNGAWSAFINGEEWNPEPWLDLLIWARNAGQPPRWALVPDQVGDRQGTLALWKQYAPQAAAYGWPLAFAAQNGMTFDDVPAEADVVFLGGDTEWKLSNLTDWCRRFPRVHVGRVNTIKRLRLCGAAGAESCDGTGPARAHDQWEQVQRFLAEQAGEIARDDQTSSFLEPTSDEMAHVSESCATGERARYGAVMRNAK